MDPAWAGEMPERLYKTGHPRVGEGNSFTKPATSSGGLAVGFMICHRDLLFILGMIPTVGKPPLKSQLPRRCYAMNPSPLGRVMQHLSPYMLFGDMDRVPSESEKTVIFEQLYKSSQHGQGKPHFCCVTYRSVTKIPVSHFSRISSLRLARQPCLGYGGTESIFKAPLFASRASSIRTLRPQR